MENIGYKLRVPPKTDRKAWDELERIFRAEVQREVDVQQQRTTWIRAKIKTMKARPLTKGRAEELEHLEAELKQLLDKLPRSVPSSSR